MVSSIQLGNFFTANGKTVLGGVGGSGLDTQSLIKGLTDAKALPEQALKDKITLNDKKSASLSDFQTLLSKFQDATNFLRNPPGVGNAADNVFAATTTSVTSNTAVAGSTYMTATAAPGSTLQSYSITDFTSIAHATQQASGSIVVADINSAPAVFSTAGVGKIQAGTITLRGKSITLSNGDTLGSVVNKFNAVSSTTGISASIIQVQSGTYQLQFSATQTGVANKFDFTNPGDIADPITDTSGVLSHMGITPKQLATNAAFTFNGTPIVRATNNITDLVDGVTFSLLQAPPEDTELTVSLSSDQDLIKSGIVNFVNTYNALQTFYAKQTEPKSDGTGYADTALLHDNQMFRTTMNNVNAFLSGGVSGLASGKPNLLANLGITFGDLPKSTDNPEVKNILTVDESKLTTAISSQSDDVRRIFEFDFTSDNSNLRIFKRSNTLGVSDFTLNVNPYATQTTQTLEVADADTAIVATTPTSTQLKAGVITINGQSITLADGDSLNTIISKFTAVQSDTHVTPSLVTVGTGQYKLVFTSAITSGSSNFNLNSTGVDPSGVFTNAGISATASYTASYTLKGVPTTVDLDATFVSATSGYLLKGKNGTALAGLQLIYSSTNSSAITVHATQGIADKLYNLGDGILTQNTGALAVEVKSLTDNDTKLTADIQKIEDQITIYRDQLIAQFANLEKAISQVNTLLQSLQANTDAYNNR